VSRAQVLDFFRSQGMPHPYAPPLLLVESGVLEGGCGGLGGSPAQQSASNALWA